MAHLRAGFAPRLEASCAIAWRTLTGRGMLHPHAELPDLELPEAFAETLAAAMAESSTYATALGRHYLDTMPAQRVEQLATCAEPNATLLHTPLELARLPRLAGAVFRLDELLAAAGVPGRPMAARFGGAPTLAQLYARSYYGGFMPLLYGTPPDLARAARALASSSALAVIDRYLTAPIVHELTHFDRRRSALLPLHLDECVAGYLGVRVLPEFAYPAPGEDNGLYAAPWFAQIGQALARVVGLERLVAAHVGVVPWSTILPRGFAETALCQWWGEYQERHGLHFLSDPFRPEAWLSLIFAGTELASVDAEDERMVADGLRAMCLENRIVDGAHSVMSRLCSDPIAIDAIHGTIRHGSLSYVLAPSVGRRLRAAGLPRCLVRLRRLEEIPELAHVLCWEESKIESWRVSFS